VAGDDKGRHAGTAFTTRTGDKNTVISDGPSLKKDLGKEKQGGEGEVTEMFPGARRGRQMSKRHEQRG